MAIEEDKMSQIKIITAIAFRNVHLSANFSPFAFHINLCKILNTVKIKKNI